MQSAVVTMQAVGGCRDAGASARTSVVVRSASITLAPCTWCSQRGSAGSSARSRLRPASLPASPSAAVVTNACARAVGHSGRITEVVIFLYLARAQLVDHALEV